MLPSCSEAVFVLEIAVRNRTKEIAFLDGLLFPFSHQDLLDEELVTKILLCNANEEVTPGDWVVSTATSTKTQSLPKHTQHHLHSHSHLVLPVVLGIKSRASYMQGKHCQLRYILSLSSLLHLWMYLHCLKKWTKTHSGTLSNKLSNSSFPNWFQVSLTFLFIPSHS